jgi:hypothetical protein
VSCRVQPPRLGASQRGYLWLRVVVPCRHDSTLRVGVVAGGRCWREAPHGRVSVLPGECTGCGTGLSACPLGGAVARQAQRKHASGAGQAVRVWWRQPASPTAAKRTMPPRQAGRVSRQGVVPTAERRPQTAPNQGLELTAYSVRFAPAFSRSSGPAISGPLAGLAWAPPIRLSPAVECFAL